MIVESDEGWSEEVKGGEVSEGRDGSVAGWKSREWWKVL